MTRSYYKKGVCKNVQKCWDITLYTTKLHVHPQTNGERKYLQLQKSYDV